MSRRIVSTLVLGLGGAALFLACDDAPELGPGSSFDASVADLDASITPPPPQTVDGFVDGGIEDEYAAPPPPATYAITAKVIGLKNAGLRLVDPEGGTTTVDANGGADVVASFPNRVLAGTAYAVAIDAQPSAQRCEISGNTGTVVGGDITSIVVNCTGLFTVGGTVSGLDGKGLTLQSGNEVVAANGNGTFAFSTPLPTGTDWSVSVKTQPTSAWQTCSASPASGKIGTASVNDVRVTCASNPYRVGVTVTGLSGAGLVLRNNGGDDLRVTGSGSFDFATTVLSGKAYDVTVATQPSSPTQSCTVASGKGTMGGAKVTLAVTCATSAFAYGGSVKGLQGTKLVLSDGKTDITLDREDKFSFPKIPSGSTYNVFVKSGPTGVRAEYCRVVSGSGTVGASEVTNIAVTCGIGKSVFVTSRTFSGNLGGLDGADNECAALAKKAGISGEYRAWLSDATGSPVKRFKQADVPYLLLDGRIIAGNWKELVGGKIGQPIDVTERGGKPPVSSGTCKGTTSSVWSNTTESGELLDVEATCGNWNGKGSMSIWGSYVQVDPRWTNDCKFGGGISYCQDSQAPLYCFEQ